MFIVNLHYCVQFLEGLFQDMAIVKKDLERDNYALLEQVRDLKNQNKVMMLEYTW